MSTRHHLAPAQTSPRPSHQRRHKSGVSLRGPPCAHGVSGTPHGEVRDKSPIQRNSDRSRTPDRARTPIRHRTPDPETTPNRGRIPMAQASPSSPPDCQMVSTLPPPPSRAASSRDPRTASISGGQNPEQCTGSDHSPLRSVRRGSTVSGTPGSGTPRAEGAGDSEDEVAPSPNMRRMLTRLQKASPEGGSSAVTGLGSHQKDEAAQK